MLEAKPIREIQAEIANIIDEKGLNQLKIMNCIAGLWLYGEELDTLYEKGEEKEIEIVFLKIGILADEISEAVDKRMTYLLKVADYMKFDTLDRMCEVTEFKTKDNLLNKYQDEVHIKGDRNYEKYRKV